MSVQYQAAGGRTTAWRERARLPLPYGGFWLLLVALAAAALIGLGLAFDPLSTTVLVIAVVALGHGLLVMRRLDEHWLRCLGVALVGYASLGRGFAYIGYPPVFLGELILGLGLFAVLLGRSLWPAFRSPLVWLLMLFALYGAFCTVPYIETYQHNAIRDAVVWGYGLFAVLTAAFLSRPGMVSRIIEAYGRVMPWFALWLPFAYVIEVQAYDLIPRLPGSNAPILAMKPGDAAVHLGALACFIVLGLNRQGDGGRVRTSWPPTLLWAIWLLSTLMMVTINRGGLLAVVTSLCLVVVVWPKLALRLLRPLIIAIIAGGLYTVLSWQLTPEGGGGREISPQQVVANMMSIVQLGENADLDATAQWRLNWWTKIVDYTVYGDYFWNGKGFGVNLADDDGFQVESDATLRSPHNGHLTILARMGVPGLALWVALQGAFAFALLAMFARARFVGLDWWARVNLWILAYWAGFMVNASFDVVLEGPQGGIWFWSIVGFGMAVLEAQRRLGRPSAVARPARAAVGHAPAAIAGHRAGRRAPAVAVTTSQARRAWR